MKYYITERDDRRNASTGLAPIIIIFKEGEKKFVVSTGIFVKGGNIPTDEPNYKAKARRLIKITDEIDEYLLNFGDNDFEVKKARLKSIVTGKEYTDDKLLVKFINDYAATKTRKGTAELFRLTAKKVNGFDGRATFKDVDAAWLDGFVRSLGAVSVNYASIHLRNIRTVFNWAIDNEWTQCYPFRRYKIKSEKVAINNISVAQLRAIRDYPLDDWRRVYRDLFMLTFYLCGINPIDLLNLRPEDMKNGRIRYTRAKTGRMYDIPVPSEAMEIIERYRGQRWLLWPLERYASHKDFAKHWNRALKRIGTAEIVPDKVGRMRKVVYHPIVEGVTIYTARYTFASIGAELDIPRETIALCLGHAWTDVTSHYIAYDNKKIDAAVRKIIDYVNEGR